MSIIIQKFGGSSVADTDRLRRVADRIVGTYRAGHQVVAVVSAMGSTTDELLHLATELNQSPSRRELDVLLSSGEQVSSALLAMAIQSHGVPSVALTGHQCGILTDGEHGAARIVSVDPRRVQHELSLGQVVVVAGFQGLSPDNATTTLGRGGSDTTAVALAAAVKAERCEIYSDVDGVHSADPRVVPEARLLDEISYLEMQQLARYGARVLSSDAIDYASDNDVEIRARSTFSDKSGTRVYRHAERSGDASAAGVAGRKDIVLINARTDPAGTAELTRRLFETVRNDDVLCTYEPADGGGLEMLVSTENVADADTFVSGLGGELASMPASVSPLLGCVSAVGQGLGQSSAHAAAQRAVGDLPSPPVRSYSTGEVLTYVLPIAGIDAAIRALHAALFTASGPDLACR